MENELPDNVVYLTPAKFKRKDDKLTINRPRREEEELSKRTRRIRDSMDRINKLMQDLKTKEGV